MLGNKKEELEREILLTEEVIAKIEDTLLECAKELASSKVRLEKLKQISAGLGAFK